MMDKMIYKCKGTGRLWTALCLLAAMALLASCSTTRKLADGEMLYVGVKKMDIVAPEKVKLNSTQSSAASSPLSVKPNNSLYAPYLRSPFALGLWVYNWDIKRENAPEDGGE